MNQFELRKSVDQILWEEWDPKGMKGQEGAYDEYYRFIPPIVELLNNQGTVIQMSELLHQFVYEDLVQQSEPEDHLEVAGRLCGLVVG